MLFFKLLNIFWSFWICFLLAFKYVFYKFLVQNYVFYKFLKYAFLQVFKYA